MQTTLACTVLWVVKVQDRQNPQNWLKGNVSTIDELMQITVLEVEAA